VLFGRIYSFNVLEMPGRLCGSPCTLAPLLEAEGLHSTNLHQHMTFLGSTARLEHGNRDDRELGVHLSSGVWGSDRLDRACNDWRQLIFPKCTSSCTRVLGCGVPACLSGQEVDEKIIGLFFGPPMNSTGLVARTGGSGYASPSPLLVSFGSCGSKLTNRGSSGGITGTICTAVLFFS